MVPVQEGTGMEWENLAGGDVGGDVQRFKGI